MSDLLRLGADGDSALAIGSYGQHIGIGQTGSKRLPWLANLRQLWLPRLLGADGDSGPHPQQYPPGLQLPKAGFNVGSACSGGRWDSAVAMAREAEAAMAAQGQLQCRIC